MILYRYIQFAERFSNADVALLTTNLSMMVNTEQLILRMKKINWNRVPCLTIITLTMILHGAVYFLNGSNVRAKVKHVGSGKYRIIEDKDDGK